MQRGTDRKRRAVLALLATALAVAVPLSILTSTGAAASGPKNTVPPAISGTPQEGQTLTASTGTWTGTQPITYAYQWKRCAANGTSCSPIAGETTRTYLLKSVDVGNTLRIQVTATDSSGSTSATSAPTTKITRAAPATGCPAGTGTANVQAVTAPARLVIDQYQVTPSVVRRTTGTISVRFHVSDTCGQAVQGALVLGAAVPYNQFSIPPEQGTDATGWAQLQMQRLSGFPAARRQELLVLFARARKPGERLLTGISSRRLVSLPVDLSR